MTPRPYRTSKTTQLHIRVSPEELGFIKSSAETSGKSISDFIRSKIGLPDHGENAHLSNTSNQQM